MFTVTCNAIPTKTPIKPVTYTFPLLLLLTPDPNLVLPHVVLHGMTCPFLLGNVTSFSMALTSMLSFSHFYKLIFLNAIETQVLSKHAHQKVCWALSGFLQSVLCCFSSHLFTPHFLFFHLHHQPGRGFVPPRSNIITFALSQALPSGRPG